MEPEAVPPVVLQRVAGDNGQMLTICPQIQTYLRQKRKVAMLREELSKEEDALATAYSEVILLPVGTKDDFAEVVKRVRTITSKGSVEINTEVLLSKFPGEVKKILETLRGEITAETLPKGRLEGFLGKKKYAEVTQKIPGESRDVEEIIIVETDPYGK